MPSRPNYKKMYEYEAAARLRDMQEAEETNNNLKEALAASQKRNTELSQELQKSRAAREEYFEKINKQARDISGMSAKLIIVKTALAYTTRALDILNEGEEHRND